MFFKRVKLKKEGQMMAAHTGSSAIICNAVTLYEHFFDKFLCSISILIDLNALRETQCRQ